MTVPVIRTLDLEEVEELVGWAAGEGWNPGRYDAAAFHAADPEGFIGAFVDGEMVAGISAVAYGRGYGFIGLYICRPDMRGKGFGKAVWQRGMVRLEGRIVGLDGVDAQFGNYLSKGFAPAYRTIRFGGRLAADANAGMFTEQVSEELMREVAAFDGRAFPEERATFLRRWLAAPHIVRVAIQGGTVCGYGVARRCGTGWKIGGLSAVDDATAIALVGSLALAAGDEIFIDVPEPRRQLIDFLTSAGLEPGFETTRMYFGGTIPLAAELFGVTTLELG